MAQGYGLNHFTVNVCTSCIKHSVKLQPFLSSISSFECFISGTPDSMPDSFQWPNAHETMYSDLDSSDEEEEENRHSRFFHRRSKIGMNFNY